MMGPRGLGQGHAFVSSVGKCGNGFSSMLKIREIFVFWFMAPNFYNLILTEPITLRTFLANLCNFFRQLLV